MSFRDRILRALDTRTVSWENPNEVIELVELPIETVPLARHHLQSLGIVTQHSDGVSTRRPIHIGRQGQTAMYVCRSDLERAAFHLDRYLMRMQIRSWFGVAATLPAIAASSGRLLALLRELDAESMRRPSLLPGWTIGHIVAHLTQHADALVRCADDLCKGTEAVMYPLGLAARSAAIEHASRLPAGELVDDLARACEAFALSWIDVPDGSCRSVPESTPFDASTVVLRRLREIEVHGSDTGLEALAPTAWSQAFVGADLTNQWDAVHRRTNESLQLIDELGGVWRAGDNAAVAHKMTRRSILAWLLDRHHEPELATLVTWGDQSRWG